MSASVAKPFQGSGDSVFTGKRVVLGVTGGIAAYKAVDLCRRLVDAGAYVIPVMTNGAEHFIGRTTLSALASEPVQTSLWDEESPIPHTRLGQSADLVIVAPATARSLAAYAQGYSYDLLTNVLIATRAPVVVCPAMHTEMWEHPAVRANVALLRSRGVHVVEPESGRLAGGDFGAGRLAGTDTIMSVAGAALGPRDLDGVRVVVTAGGTREPIDPVRVIANRSSGKQGYAVAAEARARGALVTLISTVERTAPSGVTVVEVETAADMLQALEAMWPETDVLVMAAAVADFRPNQCVAEKLKKDDGVPQIVLEPTTDILRTLGARKAPGQVLVGFAAETGNLIANATRKLETKNLDVVVANDVAQPGVGFQHDTNAVTFVRAGNHLESIPLSDKRDIARELLDRVVELRRSLPVSASRPAR
ncbi:MAG: bifunctional phosphopantothenoylcysteine decarboxylase/phosphopantothenate--cysteine ligase CoaBC [Ilumatobacteraceae bacterium]